jgi:hypothetical protein
MSLTDCFILRLSGESLRTAPIVKERFQTANLKKYHGPTPLPNPSTRLDRYFRAIDIRYNCEDSKGEYDANDHCREMIVINLALMFII